MRFLLGFATGVAATIGTLAALIAVAVRAATPSPAELDDYYR